LALVRRGDGCHDARTQHINNKRAAVASKIEESVNSLLVLAWLRSDREIAIDIETHRVRERQRERERERERERGRDR
jgi:hypothetical protein